MAMSDEDRERLCLKLGLARQVLGQAPRSPLTRHAIKLVQDAQASFTPGDWYLGDARAAFDQLERAEQLLKASSQDTRGVEDSEALPPGRDLNITIGIDYLDEAKYLLLPQLYPDPGKPDRSREEN